MRSLDVSTGFDIHHGNTSLVNREVALPGGQKPFSQAPEEFCAINSTACVLILGLYLGELMIPLDIESQIKE